MLVKKITMKALNIIPPPAEIKHALKAEVVGCLRTAKISGVVTGRKTIVSKDTGEIYSPFSGTFYGLTYTSIGSPGLILESSLLYVPSVIEGLLDEALLRVVSGFEMAFEIGVRLVTEGERSPTGYVFEARSLIDLNVSPRLDVLKGMLSGGPYIPEGPVVVESPTASERVESGGL